MSCEVAFFMKYIKSSSKKHVYRFHIWVVLASTRILSQFKSIYSIQIELLNLHFDPHALRRLCSCKVLHWNRWLQKKLSKCDGTQHLKGNTVTMWLLTWFGSGIIINRVSGELLVNKCHWQDGLAFFINSWIELLHQLAVTSANVSPASIQWNSPFPL